jgi:hypothetical protein
MQATHHIRSIETVTSGPRSESLFRTQNTNFSAYLIAAYLLRYRGARIAENKADVDLLFEDPQQAGHLFRRFIAGAIEPVNARVLFETRAYLLSEVKRALSAGVGDDSVL